ncbi:MAG: transcription antitermination factor NusB [Candidatus Blackburnbacteria bacterium RIFCSPHIGHO2_02_FULL_39_13]|uniref:Transcription antitermination protein NusB n=1 Tax=Candidatus Blackburnbacteria bacterium RIFCSPLOWO2_01_FULL_40_20 TaxID=1797519 RepID=A0A1G1VFD0_9BACT|nr:MAG: N utilization substance protein B-like protein [Microgenomates group bacterium GW2011_GWA2_39_19]OGY07226.1 MAG: transcription antitermination factor NusB [Candidatus Blackburnbacteria bacterium RIFCSPHIGHO2_01_FULL_40_17]OGY09449.1 MAG: transcription antitermination factor NusB [Candidatus Blackburnbacteria bacterium RIFCSPHIGHO2_02_FULL_39_13]OGY14027.1 MAG: transcription antitermination factor NusB [Candidatus Blackburnbacteria bacterium RIFCSPLOWO2_01_FULL_40_20]OGY15719.1 MAG: tran
MKASSDPRHLKRKKVVQQLFAYSFASDQPSEDQTKQIISSLDKIDPVITQTAPEWPLEKLNKIDLAILRLAVFELTIEKKEPIKVIIDEAIELAKDLGSESSPSFINGVLGTIVKHVG